MKNKIFILIGLLVLLCSCGKKEVVTCELANFKATITFNRNELDNIVAVSKFENEELAASMCQMMQAMAKGKTSIECGGLEINIKDYQESLELVSNSKSDVLKYFEDKNYTCK